jgi:hypothetical protein
MIKTAYNSGYQLLLVFLELNHFFHVKSLS